ncbi:MAG: PorT family protein [Candidatus Azobacteroides sp.]|nr:PorT family protein [Candidatus Azobacteroides sp.]
MNKKRFLILAICLSVLTLSLYAQGKTSESKSFTFKFGLKAGLNLATISNGAEGIDFSPSMKADFHAGVVGNFHFGHRNEGSPAGTGIFALQPELLYSRQGFSFDGNSYNFDYLSLPIMLKFYVTKDVNIEAGPFFSYLLGVSPDASVINGAQILLSDLKNGFDVGLGIGAGFEMKSGLTFGARYSLGLSNMADNLAWKNSVIALSVGWMF